MTQVKELLSCAVADVEATTTHLALATADLKTLNTMTEDVLASM